MHRAHNFAHEFRISIVTHKKKYNIINVHMKTFDIYLMRNKPHSNPGYFL